jgi:hypothetical protein
MNTPSTTLPPVNSLRRHAAPLRVALACAAGCLAMALATGCMRVSESAGGVTRYVITGHGGGAHEPRNVSKYNLEDSAKFVLLDKGTERSVTCSGILERVLEDGRLEVIVNVRNRLNRRIEVQINCVFKDELGFPVNDEAPFTRLILTENAQEGVRFVSLNDQARTYTIRIRQSR